MSIHQTLSWICNIHDLLQGLSKTPFLQVSVVQKTLPFESQPNDEHFYTQEFDVVPETTYDFEVILFLML